MKYGLPKTTIEMIRGVFARFPEIEKAVLYGSRAKGNYQAGSDIDLTLYGDALTPDLRDRIANALDDLLLPYTIDLSLFDELDHAKLREHIERVGVVFYERVSQGVGLGTGWETKTLGEVVAIEKRQHNGDKSLPYVGMEDIASDSGLFLGNLEPKNVKGGSFLFGHQHVLYGRLRPYLNKVLLPNFEGHCSTEVFPIKPNKDIDKRFLFFWLTHSETVKQIDATCTGTRMPRANMHDVLRFNFSYPPLPEQKRIVSTLDEAFAGIATATTNAKKNLANAREVFESTLQSVFAVAWQDCELVTLADLATDITDGDHMPPPKVTTGVPFITIGNVAKDSRTIDFSDTFKVPKEYFDSLKPNKKPKIGDVLYTVTGSFGIPVLINERRDFCFQRHIGLIRPKPEISSDWLFYLLMSPQIVQQANAGATGTAQKTVSLKVLRGFKVPRLPRADQESSTERLKNLASETQRLESIYQQKLTALDELKKSILNQAFSGQLH